MHSSSSSLLIIDTDVGHDDLFAIGMLLRQHVLGTIRIHAFTTVKGLTTSIAGYKILKRLLLFCGLHDQIQVLCGYDSAFDKHNAHLFTEAEWMTEQMKHKFEFVADDILLPPYVVGPTEEPNHNVVSTVLQWIADAEDQTFQLLCLGPLSNIAYMSQQDPSVLARFSSITMMGGFVKDFVDRASVSFRESEYNMYADPLGAFQVFSDAKSVNKEIIMCGLEVANATQVSMNDLEQMMEQIGPMNLTTTTIERNSLEAITEFLRRMFYYSSLESVSFDSIAVTRLFQPELFLEEEKMQVIINPNPPNEGQVIQVQENGTSIILPVSFDKHAYLSLLKQVLQVL
jgi:inosine-uridine nucleoside N-ribohydrolase